MTIEDKLELACLRSIGTTEQQFWSRKFVDFQYSKIQKSMRDNLPLLKKLYNN